jgi:hypothetical protein
VTTEFRAAATTPVMSPCSIIVVDAELVVAGLALAVGLGVTTVVVREGPVRPTRASVEPDASAADRRAAVRTVPTVLRPGPEASGVLGAGGDDGSAGSAMGRPAAVAGDAAMSLHERIGGSTDRAHGESSGGVDFVGSSWDIPSSPVGRAG